MWKLASADATGTSHVKSGAPCQDRHAFLADGDNLIIAVADGAGSASRSDEGAQAAVETVVSFLAPHLSHTSPSWDELVVDAAREARRAVLDLAGSQSLPARDFACTLLILALSGAEGAVLQIGDGLVAYRDGEEWGWFFWPQKGQYANTTHFLIEDDAEANFEHTAIRERLTEVAVMSDGLENIALHLASRSVHQPFFEAVIAPLRAVQEGGISIRISNALEGFLRSERITSRTDDDLTLVLAART